MSKQEAGSYAFSDLKQSKEELQRLKEQARIGIPLEKEIWKNQGLQSDHHVLDLACGPGITSCAFAELVREGSVTGVDINDELLQEARSEAKDRAYDHLNFIKGNVYELVLPDNTYDFVYARFLFQHLQEPEKALKEIQRVLKPGGCICILDVDDGFTAYYPEPEGFSELLEQANKVQELNGGDRFIGRKLKAMFVRSGYQEAQINLLPITSDTFGMKTFVDITTGFKAKQLGFEDESKTMKILDDIYKQTASPEAWAVSCVFVCSARKSN